MKQTLAEMRREISTIDEQIIKLLGKRMELCHAIGRRKVERGLPVPHPRRDAKVLDDAQKRAHELRLSRRFVERIYALILAESRSIQERLAESRNKREPKR